MTTIKSFHAKAVSDSKSLLTHKRVLQTASPQIAANFPRPYRTTISQLHSSFCSSLHPYREKIGLIFSPLSPSCEVEPHITVHVLSCSSHPHPRPSLTYRNVPAWRWSSCFASLSPISRLFILLSLSPSFWRIKELGAIIIKNRSNGRHTPICLKKAMYICIYCSDSLGVQSSRFCY